MVIERGLGMADNNNNGNGNGGTVTPATTKEMLDSVNSAILAIAVGGQSYKIGSRSLTRADLKQLYAIKNDLTAQLASENNNSGLLDDCYVAVFDGR